MTVVTKIDLGEEKTIFFDEEIRDELYGLIRTATESLVFVTPYIRFWPDIEDEILNARKRGVTILFYIRMDDNETKEEDMEWLRSNKIKVNLIPYLHAKIYYNEKRMLISSINMHRKSIVSTREFAYVINDETERQIFRDYVSGLTHPTVLALPPPERFS